MTARLLVLGWLIVGWLEAATAAGKLAAIPLGAAVEVKLQCGENLRGRLGPIAGDTFEIQLAMDSRVESRQIPIAQLRSIKRTDQTHPARIVLITIAVMYGLGLLITLALGD